MLASGRVRAICGQIAFRRRSRAKTERPIFLAESENHKIRKGAKGPDAVDPEH